MSILFMALSNVVPTSACPTVLDGLRFTLRHKVHGRRSLFFHRYVYLPSNINVHHYKKYNAHLFSYRTRVAQFQTNGKAMIALIQAGNKCDIVIDMI
jgi:hypothetical protein